MSRKLILLVLCWSILLLSSSYGSDVDVNKLIASMTPNKNQSKIENISVEPLTELFGVKLGEPFHRSAILPLNKDPVLSKEKIKPPLRVFGAPVPANSNIKVFHDFEVKICGKNNKVASIIAKRAYNMEWECRKERKKIMKYLVFRFGKPKKEEDVESWTIRSQDENRWMRVGCHVAFGDPYYVLTLEFHDVIQEDIINREIDKLIR